MTKFLSEVIEWQKFELLIDSQIFPINIVLKASYNFLDKGYFFFKYDENKNIILVFTKKEDVKLKHETIIWDFSDELLSVLLRDKLEVENKYIRETIVWAAIANSIDTNNFVSLDTNQANTANNQIDFDKDIDEILREIENDPDLKIDEDEIAKILAEIEEESKNFDIPEPTITLDTNAIKDVKAKFWNR